jgi:DNA-binding winged helix-turn-helix (wHTH) protein
MTGETRRRSGWAIRVIKPVIMNSVPTKGNDIVYEFGPFRLEIAERRLIRDSQPVEMRAKVFDTLRVLVENHGHLVGKDQLLQAVWPDSVVEEGNLAHNLAVLRKALGEKTGGERYIQTVPAQGYRFVAAVRTVEGAGRAMAAQAPVPRGLREAGWNGWRRRRRLPSSPQPSRRHHRMATSWVAGESSPICLPAKPLLRVKACFYCRGPGSARHLVTHFLRSLLAAMKLCGSCRLLLGASGGERSIPSPP